jgi:hypothetical protein
METFWRAWAKGIALTATAVGIPVLIFVLDSLAKKQPMDWTQALAIAAGAALIVVKSWQTKLHIEAMPAAK